MHTEAFQFNSFEVDDTPKKKARLSGGPVANPGEPEVEVEVETGLKHTRSDGDGAATKKGKRSDGDVSPFKDEAGGTRGGRPTNHPRAVHPQYM